MSAFDASRILEARRAEGVDTRAIEAAIKMLLIAIGEDPAREGLIETPARVARAWKEFTTGLREDPAKHLERQFTGESADRGLVLQRDITFYSLCEHHLIPFYGRAHVAYIPNQDSPSLVGLSKLARVVRGYAARPQVQERLTAQIVEALMLKLEPYGAAVVVEAEHLCMGMRGVKAPGSVTVTSEVRGIFKDDERTRGELMALLGPQLQRGSA